MPLTPKVLAGLKETSRQLLQKWVQQGFIVVVDLSKRARKYKLSEDYRLENEGHLLE